MDKPRTYIETSVISYLAARPSGDALTALHQQITHAWWKGHDQFELFISEFVLIEVHRGDVDAAQRRIDLLAGVPLLLVDARVNALAEQLLSDGAIPAGAINDAAHIAVATVHSMQFIATWNFKHMASAFAINRLRDSCEGAGYRMPTICTPEQLAGDFLEPLADA